MNRILRVTVCLLLGISIFFWTSCLATDINMNLQSDTNATGNELQSNSSIDNNSQMTTTVESSSQNESEGLTIEAILNILLIVVGIVLIFFVLIILVPMLKVYMGTFMFSAAGI